MKTVTPEGTAVAAYPSSYRSSFILYHTAANALYNLDLTFKVITPSQPEVSLVFLPIKDPVIKNQKHFHFLQLFFTNICRQFRHVTNILT